MAFHYENAPITEALIDIRVQLRTAGLHTLDAVIAATALDEGLTLATRNRKHFQMIRDLKLEVPNH